MSNEYENVCRKMTLKEVGVMYMKLCIAEDKLEAMSDYKTHHHDWVAACQVAKDCAETGDDFGDICYWQHQIDTLSKLRGVI